MTPEIETELNGIGWARVQFVHPWRAKHLESAISISGGLLFESKGEATISSEQIKELRDATAKARHGLNSLPPSCIATIEVWADRPEGALDPNWQRVPDALNALSAIEGGLEMLQSNADHEAKIGRSGKPTNDAAHRVASALAEIYIIGTGQIPRCGTDAITGKINGRFGKVVERVFALLGFKGVRAITFAKAAKAKLTDECIAEMLDLHAPKRRMKLSLVTGQPQSF